MVSHESPSLGALQERIYRTGYRLISLGAVVIALTGKLRLKYLSGVAAFLTPFVCLISVGFVR